MQSDEEYGRRLQEFQAELAFSNELQQKLQRVAMYHSLPMRCKRVVDFHLTCSEERIIVIITLALQEMEMKPGLLALVTGGASRIGCHDEDYGILSTRISWYLQMVPYQMSHFDSPVLLEVLLTYEG